MVTVKPLTGFPFASVTATTKGAARGVPAIPLCPSPEMIAILEAGPWTPVSVNVTGDVRNGLPPASFALAVIVLGPTRLPSTNGVEARPEASVTTTDRATEPPPDVTANVTVWFATT